MNSKKTLVFVTNNSHKLAELRAIIGDDFDLCSLADIGCGDDIPEPFDTLEENALAKARWVKQRYGFDCFADDTGLEVDALGGQPGVRSARYAGDGHDSAANMALLLKNMENHDRRTARFRTVIALIEGDDEHLFEGVVEGNILREQHGEEGFGYDPVFQPLGWDRTFAQASPSEKNAVSHRGRAVKKLIDYLKNRKR